MAEYIVNIEQETNDNTNFRKVIFTDTNMQLVLMHLKPEEEIGMEMHSVDQFLRIEKGLGKVIINGKETSLVDGSAIVVPAGTLHNIINTSSIMPLKLYTIYTPPQHPQNTIHKTKEDAIKEEYP